MAQNLKLNDSKWKEFFFEDILIVTSGKRLTKADMGEGTRPFVGASDSNNGITYFTSSTNESIDKNVLGVNYNGSVGCSFYHPYEALFSDDVKRVRWREKAHNNRYTLLFLSTVILQQKNKYAYGYKFNGQRMKRQKILLPVTSSGVLDWQFMEEYMKQKEQQILKPTIERLCNRLITNNIIGGANWNNFLLRDLFPILVAGKSKGLNHIEKSDCGISYLGATNQNNGVLCFVNRDKNTIQKGNCIAFIRNGEGSMGYSVYKAEDFIATSDMTLGYNNHLNRYTGTFITTVADRVRGKYNFGYKRNAARLSKEIITLPVDSNGSPDWKYMENYMRNIESERILKYLHSINRRNIQ